MLCVLACLNGIKFAFLQTFRKKNVENSGRQKGVPTVGLRVLKSIRCISDVWSEVIE